MGEIYRAVAVTGVRRLDERRQEGRDQPSRPAGQDKQGSKAKPGKQGKQETQGQQAMPGSETGGRMPTPDALANTTETSAGDKRVSDPLPQEVAASLELELNRLTDLRDIQEKRIQQLEAEKEEMLADLKALAAELQAATEQTDDQREQEASAGYEAGLRQAREEIDQERSKLVEDVRQLRKLFSGNLEDQLRKVDEFAVEIAFAALTRVVGEHFGDEAFARAVVAKAVNSVRGAKKVAVHVAQQDFDLINRLEGEILSSGQISEIEFVPDPRVTVGGCLIETETGVWDARLETQLQRLRDAIESSVRAKD